MFSKSLCQAALATALAACGAEMFQLELGSTERPVSAVTVAQVTSDNRWFGQPVVVGDIDGDGVSDAVLVADAEDPNHTPNIVGTAYVVYGGTAVTGTISADSLPQLSDIDVFPQIIPVGDVDGDGLADFLVTTMHGTYLIYGHATRFAGATRVGDAGVLLRGGSVDVYPAVAALGDLDGDGLDDFAIGLWPGTDQVGTVSLFYGRAGRFTEAVDVSTAADAAIMVPGSDRVVRFNIGSLGDVDGDGRPDFLIGASLVRGPSARFAGVVALADIAAAQLTSELVGGEPAPSVALGDLDGDGLADFALAEGHVSAGMDYDYLTRSYRIFYGRAGGFPASLDPGSADATIVGALSGPAHGWTSLAAIDDGKGHRDLVVGDPLLHDENGGVHVLHTAGARLSGTVDLSVTESYVGTPRHAGNCDFATGPGCTFQEGLGLYLASGALTGGDRTNVLVCNTTSSSPKVQVHGSSAAAMYVLSLPNHP